MHALLGEGTDTCDRYSFTFPLGKKSVTRVRTKYGRSAR
jgi:hypothetical protein